MVMKTLLYIHSLSSSGASGTARYRRMHIHQSPQGRCAEEAIAKTWALFGDRDTAVNCREEYLQHFATIRHSMEITVCGMKTLEMSSCLLQYKQS